MSQRTRGRQRHILNSSQPSHAFSLPPLLFLVVLELRFDPRLAIHIFNILQTFMCNLCSRYFGLLQD